MYEIEIKSLCLGLIVGLPYWIFATGISIDLDYKTPRIIRSCGFPFDADEANSGT